MNRAEDAYCHALNRGFLSISFAFPVYHSSHDNIALPVFSAQNSDLLSKSHPSTVMAECRVNWKDSEASFINEL